MRLFLKDCTSVELHESLAHIGVTPRMARHLQAAAIRRGELPISAPGMSSRVLAEARRLTTLPHLDLVKKVVSPTDGFAKYLFRGDGDGEFESVRIPLMHRPDDLKYIVCVSCQVGCAMGCTFCTTGQMGFTRNLAAWEIVDQVVKIQADSQHPVRGVVFMGMGEPMVNYDAVLRAARVISEPCGMAIAGKAITISTVGIVQGIRRFTAERHPFRLVISLTSADPDKRRELVPVENTHSTAELMNAIRGYQAAIGGRVTLAWTMISGVNTSEDDARQLAALTKGIPIKLDLIDVNDSDGRFRPPSADELNAFRDALRKHLDAPVVRRYSGGQDIHAACGMLAGA